MASSTDRSLVGTAGAALVGLLITAGVGSDDSAQACSLQPPPVPSFRADLADDEAVGGLVVESVKVFRPPAGCALPCGPLAGIHIVVSMPTRGARCTADFNFRFQFLQGGLPDGLRIGPTSAAYCASSPNPEGAASIAFTWSDLAPTRPFWFDLAVAATDNRDRAGPPTVVRVTHDGVPNPNRPEYCPPLPASMQPSAEPGTGERPPYQPTFGCATVSAGRPRPSAILLLLPLAALLAVRGRRRGSLTGRRGAAQA